VLVTDEEMASWLAEFSTPPRRAPRQSQTLTLLLLAFQPRSPSWLPPIQAISTNSPP